MAVVRDFIPADSETTDEDRAAWSMRGGISFSAVRHDFIPDPNDPTPPDRTADEKSAIARDAAVVNPDEAVADALAKEKLDKLGTRAAIEYIEGLGESQRKRFVRVERDNRQRVTILKHFDATPDIAIKKAEEAKGDVPVEAPEAEKPEE